jgi:hypothetical protein
LIVNGTTESYLVPSQLLEDALDVARYACLPVARCDTIPGLLPALQTLAKLAQRVSIDGISNEELVESDADWRAVRDQSLLCLELLSFDLADWERQR